MAGTGPDEQPAGRAARALAALAPSEARELAAELAKRGLNERAVRACFGVRVPLHARRRAAALPTPTELAVAAAPLWLLAGGHAIDEAPARRGLGALWQPLLELGVITCADGAARACVLLLPVGESLIVCLGRVPGAAGAPDDSSAHLAGALPPGKHGRWLDVGTGNGYAPLAARGRAAEILATDVDTAALDCARAGARLSGAAELSIRRADLLEGAGSGWDVISFNAPIPSAEPDADLLGRFWEQAARAIAPDGEVIVHSVVRDATPRPGRTVVARYTPAGIRPAFAVTRWQPGKPDEQVEIEIALTAERPHVTASALR